MLSYLQLESSLGFDKPLPVAKDWSAAPDFLKTISDFCLKNKPEIIVECSSGSSSVVLSRCCQLNMRGHVYSLENGELYADKTRQQLEDFLLSDYCDVLHAPLHECTISDKRFQWYDLKELPDIKIDMLVIDGPPGFIQQHSRFPALPLLHGSLAKRCAVFLDDSARQDEQEIVKQWLNIYPEFEVEYLDNARGCSILKR